MFNGDEMEARLLDLELNRMTPKELMDTFGTTDTAKLVVAATKALKDSVRKKDSPLTLWVHESYGRNGIVTIGMNENPNRVNFEGAKRLGIPVFIRESGGWTIFNDGKSYVFVNVFANLNSPGFEPYRSRPVDAFVLNSSILRKALGSLSPPVQAELLDKDPSTLIVKNGYASAEGKCIGMNAADGRNGLLYLEGAIRYARSCLDTAAQVLVLSDEERKDLFDYNAGTEEFSPDKTKLREALTHAYEHSLPFDSYEWKKSGLTRKEIELTNTYLSQVSSLTDMTQAQLQQIGNHPAKLCDVHWLMRKYGSYQPGVY